MSPWKRRSQNPSGQLLHSKAADAGPVYIPSDSSRSIAADFFNPPTSMPERYSATECGGLTIRARSAANARTARSRSASIKSQTKSSGCCAKMPCELSTAFGKCFKLVVTMTCALHCSTAASTCRSSRERVRCPSDTDRWAKKGTGPGATGTQAHRSNRAGQRAMHELSVRRSLKCLGNKLNYSGCLPVICAFAGAISCKTLAPKRRYSADG